MNFKFDTEQGLVRLKPSIIAFDEPCMYGNPSTEPVTYK